MAAIIVALAKAQVHDPQVLRIAALPGDQQLKALRSTLIDPIADPAFYDTVFYCEAELRGSLRRLVSDRKTGVQAVRLLSLIADTNDLRAIIRNPPRARVFSDQLWAYHVASSLLDAKEEEDWNFLRDCLMGKYDDPWGPTGAIQTLKLIGSARSIALLQQGQRSNSRWGEEIRHAISSTKGQVLPLHGRSLEELVAALRNALGTKNNDGSPRYNMAADKALVDMELVAGRELLIFTASFARVDGEWRLHGLQRVAQAYFGPDAHRG